MYDKTQTIHILKIVHLQSTITYQYIYIDRILIQNKSENNMNTVQTSFTVPTNLGKTLANINIIYCKDLFRHVGKQDKTRARTSMVKIALRKFFAGILCGCVVLLVLVVKWAMNKTIQTYPHSNCTFHHQNSQRVQTSLQYQPMLGKLLSNIIFCTCLFQHVGK